MSSDTAICAESVTAFSSKSPGVTACAVSSVAATSTAPADTTAEEFVCDSIQGYYSSTAKHSSTAQSKHSTQHTHTGASIHITDSHYTHQLSRKRTNTHTRTHIRTHRHTQGHMDTHALIHVHTHTQEYTSHIPHKTAYSAERSTAGTHSEEVVSVRLQLLPHMGHTHHWCPNFCPTLLLCPGFVLTHHWCPLGVVGVGGGGEAASTACCCLLLQSLHHILKTTCAVCRVLCTVCFQLSVRYALCDICYGFVCCGAASCVSCPMSYVLCLVSCVLCAASFISKCVT